jgi:WD40 repeat protein
MLTSQKRLNVLFLLVPAALAFGLLAGDIQVRSAQQKDPDKAEQPAKGAVDEQAIRSLIQQLGDDSYEKREAAQKRLIEIGASARDLLRKAAKENPDAEIRFRASQALQDVGSENCVLERRFDETKAGQGKRLLTRVALSPDASLVFAVGDLQPHAWDINTGREAFTFDNRPGAACWSVAISPDGNRLLAGCGGGSAHLYEAKTGKKIRALAGVVGGAWGVALLADGKRAITAGGDGTIQTWDIETGMGLGAFNGFRKKIQCLAVSPDNKLAATGYLIPGNQEANIRLWDIEKAVEIKSLKGHTLEVSSVAFSPDGKTLLSSSYDKTLRLWDIATGNELKRFEGHGGPIEAAAFSPDGSRIVSCGRGPDPSLRLWNVATGTQIAEGPRAEVGFTSVAILPDGKRCVTVDGDGPVRLWRWVK